VLDNAVSYRSLFEFLAYTGLRIGEALGLTWADVDFERNVIRVHRQLSRYREHARLKTDAANREVLLAPAIVLLLREQWLASPFKSADDFVFTAKTGRGRDYRHVGDAFRLAVKRAGLWTYPSNSSCEGREGCRSTASGTGTRACSLPSDSTSCS
jgi:integrase